MDDCTQTILKFLEVSKGFDETSPAVVRIAKALAKDITVQHLVNRLNNEILNKIERKGTKNIHSIVRKKNRNKQKMFKKISVNSFSVLPVLDVKFRVPNLTVGEVFKEKIELLDDLKGELELISARVDTSLLGLSVDMPSFMIEGKVEESGDCEIALSGFLLLVSGEKQRVKGKLKISVIPDPQSLWKNLSSDASARFHKPDTASESCMSGSVNLIAASVRGRSHAHKGIHRDDDIKIYCSPSDGWNIICVADGAGSCKYSRRGAELAVIQGTNTLREALSGHYGIVLEKIYDQYLLEKNDENRHQLNSVFQHTIVKAVYDAAKAIQNEANNNEEDTFKDFSTTYLLAAHKVVDGGHLVLSFWIGDGAAVIYDKGKNVTLLGEPDSGEYAGQTRFLDSKLFNDSSIYDRVVMQKINSMTALILATDGITDAKFETEHQMSNIANWDNLWSELEPLCQSENLKQYENDLIKWMEFWSPGNHDDRSIAICYIKDVSAQHNHE